MNAMSSEPSQWPITDRVFDSLNSVDADWIEEYDRRALDAERARVAPQIAKKLVQPTHGVKNMLREWELLINNMEKGYQEGVTIDDYMYVLDVRVVLERAYRDYKSSQGVFVKELKGLDQRFIQQTMQEGETGSGDLEKWLRPLQGREPFWLWDRRPKNLFR